MGDAVEGEQVVPAEGEERPHGVLSRLRVDPSEGSGDPEVPVGDACHGRCREPVANAATTPSLG